MHYKTHVTKLEVSDCSINQLSDCSKVNTITYHMYKHKNSFFLEPIGSTTDNRFHYYGTRLQLLFRLLIVSVYFYYDKRVYYVRMCFNRVNRMGDQSDHDEKRDKFLGA